MEGLHCLKYVPQKGDYMWKIDLKDKLQYSSAQGCTKISTVSLGRELVRVLCLWSGLGPAPKMFKKLL